MVTAFALHDSARRYLSVYVGFIVLYTIAVVL